MSKYSGLRNEDGNMPYDGNKMQVNLDNATIFNFSVDNGIYTTRALVTLKGYAAALSFPGVTYTGEQFGVVAAGCWVMMKDGGERKILMGFQGQGEKVYAMLHYWPLRPSSKHSYAKDDDIYRIKLNVSDCPIQSFEENLFNRAGFMAASNLDACLRSSHIFCGKNLNTTLALQNYSNDDVMPPFSEKLDWVFNLMTQRKRKQIAKEFKGNQGGEIQAVKNFMSILEPERMALEEQTPYYDIPLFLRTFFVQLEHTIGSMSDTDIASEALDKLSTMLE